MEEITNELKAINRRLSRLEIESNNHTEEVKILNQRLFILESQLKGNNELLNNEIPQRDERPEIISKGVIGNQPKHNNQPNNGFEDNCLPGASSDHSQNEISLRDLNIDAVEGKQCSLYAALRAIFVSVEIVI